MKTVAVLKEFSEDPDVVRYTKHVASKCLESLYRCFASQKTLGIFATYFPKVAALYQFEQVRLRLALEAIGICIPDYFPYMQFDSASLNMGRNAVSKWHRDHRNLVWGICCVGVFGRFNHEVSGRLEMKEPKAIVELRPYDLFFFPSGAVTHRSQPLMFPDQEERRVIAFWTPGGNFSWLCQGERPKSHMSKAEQDTFDEDGPSRWDRGYKLFSTVSELQLIVESAS
jgi:hypothetical protein